ncbi:MAG: hypothetical protein IIA11_02640 [Proteobacteria bacterium]|nr:hypothetical protein [Pseudomonadota bacterium]
MAKKKYETPASEPAEAPSAVPEGESGEEAAPDAEMKAFLADEEDDLETMDLDETPGEKAPEKVEGKAEPTDAAPEGKAELARDKAPAGETPAPEEVKPTEPAPKVEPAPEQPPADAPTEPVAAKPEPTVEPVPEVSAEELAKQHREWRDGQEKFLAEHYAIDDTLAEELDSDPRTVIPKLLAL